MFELFSYNFLDIVGGPRHYDDVPGPTMDHDGTDHQTISLDYAPDLQ